MEVSVNEPRIAVAVTTTEAQPAARANLVVLTLFDVLSITPHKPSVTL